MVALIHTWRENPLVKMWERTPRAIREEVEAVRRRVFCQAIVIQMYNQPYYCWEEFDELGQWADDGGANGEQP